MGIILFIVAIILATVLLPLGLIWAIVESFINRTPKESWSKINYYFSRVALSIDQIANVVCKELFNDTLRKPEGYRFGNPDETISGVLGKNKLSNTLTRSGKILDKILNLFEKNHSIEAIEKDEKNPK